MSHAFVILLFSTENTDYVGFRCMKDGAVAEMGNHDELMQKDGEYASLYKVQSAAFNSEVSDDKKVEV